MDEKDIYDIKFKDVNNPRNPIKRRVKGKDILLYLHDFLHDMCDKGDIIKITLLKSLDMKEAETRMITAHEKLHISRYHWVEEKNKMKSSKKWKDFSEFLNRTLCEDENMIFPDLDKIDGGD